MWAGIRCIYDTILPMCFSHHQYFVEHSYASYWGDRVAQWGYDYQIETIPFESHPELMTINTAVMKVTTTLNADRKFEMHSSFVEVTITVILRCDLTYDSAAHCFQWSYAMIFSWLVFWRPSAQFVLRSGFGDTAAIWTAMLGGHWLPGNLGKGSRSHAITSSSIGAWSSHPIMACHQTLTGGYGHWRLFEQIKAPLLIKILDTFPLLSSIIWPYRHIWYSGEYQNQSSLVDIMDTDGMNVPSPSFRHAAPCAPWPWVDIDDGT